MPPKKVPDTCNICCEILNKSSHMPIDCMYCQYKACRTCCQKYILSETSAKCMNTDCGKEWTRKFIRSVFPNAFIVGALKQWRENLLYDKERALLPATQPYVEAILRRREIEEQVLRLGNKIAKIRRQIQDLQRESYRLERNPLAIHDAAVADTEYVPTERKQFIKPCPADDCRGFLSTQWKCGLCSQWTCPDCHIIIGLDKEIEHVCDPNNVETAKMLRAETKACPKCHSAIYKIDGCDQMWCTQCHTAFSWRTGKIETTIHNPHYYEWMRRTNGSVPRNPLDLPCGDRNELHHNMARTIADIIERKNLHTIDKDLFHFAMYRVSCMVQRTIHYEYVRRDMEIYNHETTNRRFRIEFMMNEITEDRLKILLQRNEKKALKTIELRDVYQMIINTAKDIIFRFHDYVNSLPYLENIGPYRNLNIKYTVAPDATNIGEPDESNTVWNANILKEMDLMLEYANECFGDISNTYGCTTHMLTIIPYMGMD